MLFLMILVVLTDAKVETPVLWPPHAKSWLLGKDSDTGRDWGQEKKGATEDEMAGWHHGLDGRESEWTPGVGDGQGGLACCDSWGRKGSDTTERLNWMVLIVKNFYVNSHEWYWSEIFFWYFLLGYYGNASLWEWVRNYSFCFCPLKEIVENLCNFFLKHLLEYTSEPILVCCVLF